MIKLEDLKVGYYVENIYSNTLLIVKKINKKSFTTKQGATIYENGFEDCFVLTEDEARASIIHNYNQELKELNNNLKSLDFLLKNMPHYEVNAQALDNKINGILEKVKEKLEK